MSREWSVFLEVQTWIWLGGGLLVTLRIAAIVVAISLVTGTLLALMRLSRSRLLRWCGKAKPEKSSNAKKCRLGHERILRRNIANASEIWKRSHSRVLALQKRHGTKIFSFEGHFSLTTIGSRISCTSATQRTPGSPGVFFSSGSWRADLSVS